MTLRRRRVLHFRREVSHFRRQVMHFRRPVTHFSRRVQHFRRKVSPAQARGRLRSPILPHRCPPPCSRFSSVFSAVKLLRGDARRCVGAFTAENEGEHGFVAADLDAKFAPTFSPTGVAHRNTRRARGVRNDHPVARQ